MANTTKLALEAALKKELLTKPLDKITINDLAEDCGDFEVGIADTGHDSVAALCLAVSVELSSGNIVAGNELVHYLVQIYRRNAHRDYRLGAVYLHLEGYDYYRILVAYGLHNPGIRFNAD